MFSGNSIGAVNHPVSENSYTSSHIAHNQEVSHDINPAAKMMMSSFYYLGLWRGTGKIDPGD
jgi:hypothetical protein